MVPNIASQYNIPCVGVDEVGRGPLAGPVVACALWVEEHHTLPSTVTDSKALSKAKREKLESILCRNYPYALAVVDPQEIDQINILQATLKAMREAVNKLLTIIDHPAPYIYIDGNINPLNGIQPNSYAVVQGDKKVGAISAASIVAKVYRDRLMTNLAEQHPQYGWQKNAGYGTAEHIAAIQIYGTTTHHRISFLRNIHK